jgi:hypothetical protein
MRALDDFTLENDATFVADSQYLPKINDVKQAYIEQAAMQKGAVLFHPGYQFTAATLITLLHPDRD